MQLSQKQVIKQTLSKGKKAIKQGNESLAIQYFQSVIQLNPNHPVAKKSLRKLMGNAVVSQAVPEELIQPSQDKIDSLLNLYNTGQLIQAVELCQHLLQTYPSSLVALNILAAVYQGQNKFNKALDIYNKAIALNPEYTDAYYNRGIALNELGRYRKAVDSYDKAIELKPDYTAAYYNRGVALNELGQNKQAITSYDKAIELKPDYAEAHTNRGNALNELGQNKQAITSYDKAIELKPNYAEAYYNRGNVLAKLGQNKQSVASYNKAIELKPDYIEAYSNRGNVLSELGQYKQAITSYDKAIELKPDYAEAYYNRGSALNASGQSNQAISSYDKAIELKPDYAEAYINLSKIKKYTKNDKQVSVILNLLLHSTKDSERTLYCFTLAKVYDDLNDFDKSIKYLNEGNFLRKKELEYNINNDIKIVQQIKNIFYLNNFHTNFVQESENSAISPIFIVGMPRSGTTLVEQILSSHRDVYGAGELSVMKQSINLLFSNFISTQEMSGNIFNKKINELNVRYMEQLFELKVSENYITDKMPTNFIYIGFILLAFPKAKIINLNRDPVATCWSIYKHFFSEKGNGYAYNMTDIAKFYQLYIDIMKFWRTKFPNIIYDVSYEDLVNNQESESRKLVEYCGLEWDNNCLNFHKNKRSVKTASSTQVRKPMYKGSNEAWKKYEKHLQPMINGLLNKRDEFKKPSIKKKIPIKPSLPSDF